MSLSPEIPNFHWHEVTCRHCQEVIVDDLFWLTMEKVQALRDWWEAGLTVNSGHRCPVHNEAVGGVPDSMHLQIALDLRPSLRSPHIELISGTDERRQQIALAMLAGHAEEIGFTGVGTYLTKNFVHLDCRPERHHWNER